MLPFLGSLGVIILLAIFIPFISYKCMKRYGTPQLVLLLFTISLLTFINAGFRDFFATIRVTIFVTAIASLFFSWLYKNTANMRIYMFISIMAEVILILSALIPFLAIFMMFYSIRNIG